MKVLVLGSSGLVGNTITKYFLYKTDYETYGLLRDSKKIDFFKNKFHSKFLCLEEILNLNELEKIICNLKPNIVINCIGITNKNINNDPKFIENLISLNSLFPHKLSQICSQFNVRLIHFSSDCIFSGKKGFYSEFDTPDPTDIYGKSKLLGELNYPNTLTIRKSVIGHELFLQKGLLEWFLGQKDIVNGFINAIFSGLTVLELAIIIDKYIIPNKQLSGILNIAGQSISKYDLLSIISNEYKKKIKIIPNDLLKINRSLNSEDFNKKTGYQTKSWPQLITSMREFNFLEK